jgi:hypothetical protein
LFVLERIRMARHPAAFLHGKFSQCEVGAFLGRDQHLDGGIFSRRNIFRFDIR